MRIFTPGMELPFAGHPTLGTAFVMVSEGRVTSPATQVVAAGEIPVEVDVGRGHRVDDPAAGLVRSRVRGPRPDRQRRSASNSGISPPNCRCSRSPPACRPRSCPCATWKRSGAQPGTTARSAARSGGREGRSSTCSPSTRAAAWSRGCSRRGSTSARIRRPVRRRDRSGAYLAEHGLAGMPGSVLIRQGEQVGRPSELHVEARREDGAWRVRVGGGVHVVGRGEFDV